MGLGEALTHLLLKTTITSLILWVVLVGYLNIPMDKIGMLLLIVFLVQTIASGIASLLMFRKRGF